eukprot:m.295261 g.295261  ORF g.295261 m.295261 type:complete len:123 (+) comp40757_c0_seq51:814-1182(+)
MTLLLEETETSQCLLKNLQNSGHLVLVKRLTIVLTVSCLFSIVYAAATTTHPLIFLVCVAIRTGTVLMDPVTQRAQMAPPATITRRKSAQVDFVVIFVFLRACFFTFANLEDFKKLEFKSVF